MTIKRIIQVLVVVFIGVNFLLVYFDEEEKVERTAYVNDWSETFEADLLEKLYKPGVLKAAGAEHIYFDENLGSFQEFIVEEGNQVNPGDPLYTYQVDNYYEAEANLMSQTEQINGEIAAIETAISQMERYQLPVGMTGEPNAFTITGEQLEVELPQSSIDADLIKQQYIVEKEKELSQKVSQLEAYQSQLTELRSTGNTITVESPYAGRITDLNETLDNPVVTIESAELHVFGELTEKERTQMQPGLAAEVDIQEMSLQLDGTLHKVSSTPKSIDIGSESIYSFQVAFVEDEENEEREDEDSELEELLPGYHADVAIVTEESLGATALFEEAVFTDAVWRMTNEGKLVKQKIESGLYVGSMVELTSGVELGDWVAVDPPGLFHDGADFITPLQLKEITKDSFSDDNWAENLVTGLLSR
ncbi:efflux RND transporter periplasmic adaptor subunit [Oceanobacillus rekensis]|uniref:efflux RND transporter periplasmic adaptor subunit n=1 Tax=Oceanobacillus rekensis TaxID=937927 RepID=UPI000B435EA7|nr:efflux RND transporter periplasmic adaptor subunit [Oceanobacillus rekensis]